MLQQTQVETVRTRYYPQFLQQFPTIQALASANEQDVLNMWQGLGYYSRARNLHKAAQLSADGLPNTVDELQALPGIGRNTAHAIAAFAYQQPVPVLEANVKRIMARLYALPTPTDAQLWQAAFHMLNGFDSFTHNQAMMDIGSTICTPRAPSCLICPLYTSCMGKHEPASFPAPKARKVPPTRLRDILVLQWQNQYYLRARTSRFLGGLYGFPESARHAGWQVNGHDITPAQCQKLGIIRQQYSHFTLDAEVYLYTPNHPPQQAEYWHSLAHIVDLPLSRADEKVLALLKLT